MSERIIPHLKDAIRKVIAQGEQSRGPNAQRCAYRGVNKEGEVLCCAVGFLIMDEYYNSDFEGGSVAIPEILKALEESLGFALEDKEIQYLSLLQSAHDTWSPLKVKSFNETFVEQVHNHVHHSGLPKECLEALEGK